jgi:hypothetical protein
MIEIKTTKEGVQLHLDYSSARKLLNAIGLALPQGESAVDLGGKQVVVCVHSKASEGKDPHKEVGAI